MNDQWEVIFSEEEIRERVRALGKQITADYVGKNPLLVGVLKGCFVFMADLIRSIDTDLSVDFMVVSSYGDKTVTSGVVKIIKDLSSDTTGRHVLIVEDILDSGNTLSFLKQYLGCRNPASIKIVTLLDKPDRREAVIKADYVGFVCPNRFIVGYGLDNKEHYRYLPFIASLPESE